MDKPGAKGRESSKERHRQMLIDATAAAIAEHGLAQVSVSRILEKTGLSRGMINLHFATKQKLLVEVARHYSDQYIGSWNSAIATAGCSATARWCARRSTG